MESNTQTQLPKLWSVVALADHWGIQASTLRKWARQGRLPGVLIGKLWRFRESDLLRFLAEQDKGARP